MARLPTTLAPEQRSFSVEEVGEVIRTATSLAHVQGGSLEVRDRLSWGELMGVARELGIPEDALRRAIPEAENRHRRALKRTRRKMRFWRHAFSYAIVMSGLTVVDVLGDPEWFVYAPASIWGIFLAMHGVRTFLTGREGRIHQAVYRRELESETRG